MYMAARINSERFQYTVSMHLPLTLNIWLSAGLPWTLLKANTREFFQGYPPLLILNFPEISRILKNFQCLMFINP